MGEIAIKKNCIKFTVLVVTNMHLHVIAPVCVFKLEEETFVIHTRICLYLAKQRATAYSIHDS